MFVTYSDIVMFSSFRGGLCILDEIRKLVASISIMQLKNLATKKISKDVVRESGEMAKEDHCCMDYG